jgi:cytochrome P450
VERRRPRIEALVDELISSLAGRSECDLLAEVLYSLPMSIMCELLGATPEDREVFEETFSVQAAEVSDVGSATAEQRQAADRAIERFSDSIRELIRKHRSNPSGMLAQLIAASDEGDQLNEDEVVAAIYILIGAGHETTANLLGNGLAHLLGEHREQWDRLARQPELVPSAVEELLRFDTSVQFNQRVANEDVVFEGVEIKENERIIVLLGAANRDPEVFADPGKLDIARDPNPHLAFGAGANHCLGIHLARLQMTLALDALVRRVPELRLVGEPDWRPTWMMRGLRTLPVSFSA